MTFAGSRNQGSATGFTTADKRETSEHSKSKIVVSKSGKYLKLVAPKPDMPSSTKHCRPMQKAEHDVDSKALCDSKTSSPQHLQINFSFQHPLEEEAPVKNLAAILEEQKLDLNNFALPKKKRVNPAQFDPWGNQYKL